LRQPSSRQSPPVHARPKPRFEDKLDDQARFIKSWLDNPLMAGAVSPSGRFLARMMASYVDPAAQGPIIELGPGTGPVTQALIQHGVAPERLVLVEYDEAFCKLLAQRFPGAQIIQGDAYRLRATLAGVLSEPAAAVVSSLPLLTRPDAQRLALLADAFALMRPDAPFIQFTYGIGSPIPRKKTHAVAMPAFNAETSPPVLLNLPPARVWVYRRGAEIARLRPGEELLGKIKLRKEKIENGFRKEIEGARAKIGQRAREIEARRVAKAKPPLPRPAMALLRKLSEPKNHQP
jgi:phosphatidylethanolamine/phosphatidyl-N-methylethanolamine N-methyltransferase